MVEVGKKVSSVVILIITLIVLLSIFAVLFPEAERGGNLIDSRGLPLGTLFATGGVTLLLIAVAMFLSALDIDLGRRR